MSYLSPFPSYCRLLGILTLLTVGVASLTHPFGVNPLTRLGVADECDRRTDGQNSC